MNFRSMILSFLLSVILSLIPINLISASNVVSSGKTIVLLQEGDTEEYMFKRIIAFAAAGNGHFYVMDFNRILSYDENGKFLRYIGAVGEGPGEYKSPRGLFVDDKNHLFILDYNRIIHYDSQGEFIRNSNIEVSMSSPFFVQYPDSVFGTARSFTEYGLAQTVCKANLKTGAASHLYLVKDKETRVKGGPSGGVMGGLKHDYSSEILLAPLPGQMLCFASNNKPEIRIIDSYGNKVKTMDLGIPLEPISRDELKFYETKYGKHAAERLKLPEYRPVIDRLLTDEKGLIYIVLKNMITDASHSWKILIYDSKGNQQQKLTVDVLPWVIRGGFCYSVEKTEEHEYIIVKVKI